MFQKIKNVYHLIVALLAVVFYRYPTKNLEVIGVTGTDGKTTVVHLIAEILKSADKKVGMISTVSAKIGDEEIATGLHVTTPNPFTLQSLLRKMVNSGIKYVVLEATSHGLDQHRLFGCNFKIGVVTNVTHEHLDYHQTWENYLQAKARLFKGVEWGVLNPDDQSFHYLKEILKKRLVKFVTYGVREEADLITSEFKISARGLNFKAKNNINQSQYKIETPLLGEYNLYNCLAAISVGQILEIERKDIQKALRRFKSVTGRMQAIDEDQNFQVIIDFAHTPNALKQTLKTLKSLKSSRKKLIVVFGCAGLRDKQKRPQMGQIAGQLADLVVLTAEDPRTEDVNQIIKEISNGRQKGGAQFFMVPDRQQAIELALKKLAQKGDLVVICGKGHEKSMCYGKKEVPWSDEKAARKALKELTI